MLYTKLIEVYKITNCDFVSPLAIAPATQTYKHKMGDFIFIIDGNVWIKDGKTNTEKTPNQYSLAAYSAKFVAINKFLFEKIE